MYETKLELKYEVDPEKNLHSFNVRHVLIQNQRVVEINELLKPKSERLEEIQARFLKLDIKRNTCFDNQDMEAYEPFRLEAVALRSEFNQIEEYMLPLIEELELLVKEESLKQEEFSQDLKDGKLIVSPAQMAPFIPEMKAKYIEAYETVEKNIALGNYKGKLIPNIALTKEQVVAL